MHCRPRRRCWQANDKAFPPWAGAAELGGGHDADFIQAAPFSTVVWCRSPRAGSHKPPPAWRNARKQARRKLTLGRPAMRAKAAEIQGSARRLLSSYAAVYNNYNLQPHLISRLGLRTLRAQTHEGCKGATASA